MTYLVRRRSPRIRPRLEALETRTTPSTGAYVAGLYVNLLGRAPTAGEVAFWAEAINQGAAPGQVTSAFTSSLEFGANLVRLNYATLLGRLPGPAELNAWGTLLGVGLTDDQFEAAILASAEYYARNGSTPATWLAAVYRDELGRALDATGAAAWQQQLQLGLSREAVARQIVGSSEAHTLTVRTVYAQLLGRVPDPSGQTFWVSQLNAGLTLPRFLAQVAATVEYINRTSQGGLDIRPVIAATQGQIGPGLQALTEAPRPATVGTASTQAQTTEQRPSRETGVTLVAGSPLLTSPFGTLPGFNPAFFGLDPTFFALTGLNPFTAFLQFFPTGLPTGGFSTLNVPAFGSNTFVALVFGFIDTTGLGFPGFGTPGFAGNTGTITIQSQ